MMEDGKEVSLHSFSADQKITSAWKNASFSILYHEQQGIACCHNTRHILTSKMSLKTWNCQLHEFTVTAFHFNKKYAPEVKAVNSVKRL